MKNRDDQNYRDEYEYEEEYEEREENIGFFARIKNLLLGDLDEAEIEDDNGRRITENKRTLLKYPESNPVQSPKQKKSKPSVEGGSNVVNFRNKISGNEVNMIICEPNDLEDASLIVAHIREGRGCIVNLEGVEHETSQRIADFISGAIYTIGGEVKRVSNEIFTASPTNVIVTEQMKEVIKKGGSRFLGRF
jgi:cell division inhibitor SepF